MKYYIDSEFLEGTQSKSPLMLKLRRGSLAYGIPTIDLISIAVVAEDGREYYAIAKDFNLKEAWNRYDLRERTDYENFTIEERGRILYRKVYWLRDNVLKPIYEELIRKELHSDFLAYLELPFTYKSMKYLINKYGKDNKTIATEIFEFTARSYAKPKSDIDDTDLQNNWPGNFKPVDKIYYADNKIYFQHEPMDVEFKLSDFDFDKPVFYGYYADYDWVRFCWLYGKMIDKPAEYPFYCIDLQQEYDRVINNIWHTINRNSGDMFRRLVFSTPRTDYYINRIVDSVEELDDTLKRNATYPKNTNEHNALADAKWTMQFHNWIQRL